MLLAQAGLELDDPPATVSQGLELQVSAEIQVSAKIDNFKGTVAPYFYTVISGCSNRQSYLPQELKPDLEFGCLYFVTHPSLKNKLAFPL